MPIGAPEVFSGTPELDREIAMGALLPLLLGGFDGFAMPSISSPEGEVDAGLLLAFLQCSRLS
jgi:hypothetical protein